MKMRNLKTVFDFEFATLAKKRTMRVTTLILMVVILAITFIPRFINMSDSGNESASPSVSVVFPDSGYVIADASLEAALISSRLLDGAHQYSDQATLEAAVKNKSIKDGFVVNSATSFVYVVNDLTLTSSSESTFSTLLRKIAIERMLIAEGIDPQVVSATDSVVVSGSTVVLGRDSSQGIIFVYAFIIVVYILILLYGTSVSTSVAREKDSRTMELLITSTNPRDLILGKVFAAGLVGILQIAAVTLAGVIGLQLNRAFMPDLLLHLLQGALSPSVILTFIVFGVCGYLLYLFVYAALGSLVSKVEDVSSSVAPITVLFVFAYLFAIMAITTPDSALIRISTYIPFVSLFTTPIRTMVSTLEPWNILVSLAIMVVATGLIAALSIFIYRFGSLNYGNKLKLRPIIKSIFSKKS